MAKRKRGDIKISIVDLETELTSLAEFAQYADLSSMSLYLGTLEDDEREELHDAIRLLKDVYSK